MTGPGERLPKDDDWCDWCGKEIPAQTRRSYDGRVFCRDRCLAEYRTGAESPTVVELSHRKPTDES